MPFKISVQAAMFRSGLALVSAHSSQVFWLAPKAGVVSNKAAIEAESTIRMEMHFPLLED